jgi:hypothetical protein
MRSSVARAKSQMKTSRFAAPPVAESPNRPNATVQLPVYESLSDQEIERVGRLVREQVARLMNWGPVEEFQARYRL